MSGRGRSKSSTRTAANVETISAAKSGPSATTFQEAMVGAAAAADVTPMPMAEPAVPMPPPLDPETQATLNAVMGVAPSDPVSAAAQAAEPPQKGARANSRTRKTATQQPDAEAVATAVRDRAVIMAKINNLRRIERVRASVPQPTGAESTDQLNAMLEAARYIGGNSGNEHDIVRYAVVAACDYAEKDGCPRLRAHCAKSRALSHLVPWLNPMGFGVLMDQHTLPGGLLHDPLVCLTTDLIGIISVGPVSQFVMGVAQIYAVSCARAAASEAAREAVESVGSQTFTV